MIEDEQREFEDNVKMLSMQLRLFVPQLSEHTRKLEDGTAKMHELELSLRGLKCGEHEVEIGHFKEHIDASSKWRMAIFTIAIGLIVTVVGAIQTWGAVQEKINNIERIVYEKNH